MSDTNPDTGRIPPWTLGWRMKRSLAHAGMKAEDMAEELGFDPRTISRWVNEKGAPPRAVYLKQWAMATGVPYRWLSGQEPGDTSEVPVTGSRWNVPGASGPGLRLAS